MKFTANDLCDIKTYTMRSAQNKHEQFKVNAFKQACEILDSDVQNNNVYNNEFSNRMNNFQHQFQNAANLDKRQLIEKYKIQIENATAQIKQDQVQATQQFQIESQNILKITREITQSLQNAQSQFHQNALNLFTQLDLMKDKVQNYCAEILQSCQSSTASISKQANKNATNLENLHLGFSPSAFLKSMLYTVYEHPYWVIAGFTASVLSVYFLRRATVIAVDTPSITNNVLANMQTANEQQLSEIKNLHTKMNNTLLAHEQFKIPKWSELLSLAINFGLICRLLRK